MKTAISIPDELHASADRLAKRMGISRSELYSRAVADYLDRRGSERVTERLNQVYAAEDSSLDPGFAALQFHALARRSKR